MYIFELIYKIIDKIKNKEKKQPQDFMEEYEACDHIFVPVDSTKRVLACTKCGVLKKLKNSSVDET